jgi:hypothetical protein
MPKIGVAMISATVMACRPAELPWSKTSGLEKFRVHYLKIATGGLRVFRRWLRACVLARSERGLTRMRYQTLCSVSDS